jgi:hypothetical protein
VQAITNIQSALSNEVLKNYMKLQGHWRISEICHQLLRTLKQGAPKNLRSVLPIIRSDPLRPFFWFIALLFFKCQPQFVLAVSFNHLSVPNVSKSISLRCRSSLYPLPPPPPTDTNSSWVLYPPLHLPPEENFFNSEFVCRYFKTLSPPTKKFL